MAYGTAQQVTGFRFHAGLRVNAGQTPLRHCATVERSIAAELVDRSMDLMLIALIGLLLATLVAFIWEIIPYPYGLLVLSALIAARILYLRGGGKRWR